MDLAWEVGLHNSEFEQCYHSFLPNTNRPVHLLGRMYLSLNDRKFIDEDIRSRIWCTYRKNFKSINNGPNSDKGWGCMHRCGQMMVAECLLRLKLSRDWRWNPQALDKEYWKILKMFEDRSSSLYSIHSIAMMGVSENKPVGEWLGPNTISHILKKLVTYDLNNQIKIFVTNEEGIIYDEIKSYASKDPVNIANTKLVEENECSSQNSEDLTSSTESIDFLSKIVRVESEKVREDSGLINIKSDSNILDPSDKKYYQPSDEEDEAYEVIEDTSNFVTYNKVDVPSDNISEKWNPLLLMIPIRLGLSKIIPEYFKAILSTLKHPSSVGILGGRPSHAQWIIGYIENSTAPPEMICLDPHTTQQAARFNSTLPSPSEDALFHCEEACTVNLANVDPSMSIGFFFKTEIEFDSFMKTFEEEIKEQGKYPLTGFHWTRPKNFRWREAADPISESTNKDLNVDYEIL